MTFPDGTVVTLMPASAPITDGQTTEVDRSTMRREYAYRPRGTDPLAGRRWPNRTVTLGNPETHSPEDARIAANRVKQGGGAVRRQPRERIGARQAADAGTTAPAASAKIYSITPRPAACASRCPEASSRDCKSNAAACVSFRDC